MSCGFPASVFYAAIIDANISTWSRCLDREGSFIVETTIWEKGEKKIR